MKNFIKAFSVLALAICLAGCVLFIPNYFDPTAEELASANYGKPVDELLVDNILPTAIKSALKDPYSAKIKKYIAPIKGWIANIGGFDDFRGRKYQYGYFVVYKVNAKNSFGAYTGDQSYYFLIRDNKIISSGRENETGWSEWGFVR